MTLSLNIDYINQNTYRIVSVNLLIELFDGIQQIFDRFLSKDSKRFDFLFLSNRKLC